MSTRDIENLQRLIQQPLLLARNRVLRSYTGGALLEALQGEVCGTVCGTRPLPR